MDKTTRARPPNHKKKFRSPVCGKRPHKTSVFPKFRLNLKEQEKHIHKGKHKSSKTGSKLRFRLGGDSTDPLNLNSLINRDPSEVTPQCSPYVDRAKETSPHVFVQPQDLTDPLNLKCDLYQDLKGIVVVTPTRKKRKRKHNDGSNCREEDRENEQKEELGEKKCVENVLPPKVKKKKKAHQKVKDCKDGRDKDDKRKKVKVNSVGEHKEEICETMDETIEGEKQSEVSKDLEQKMGKVKKMEVLQAEDKLSGKDSEEISSTASLKKFAKPNITGSVKNFQRSDSGKPKSKKTFIYGNYNRYYGYRNPNSLDDPRLKLFKAEWFKDKDVLDIGCNIGNVTLQVGREFGPRHVLGIDIDSSLIRAANKYLRCCIQDHQSTKSSLSTDFPLSFVVCRGPIISSGCTLQEKDTFPYNVEFKEENFIPKNDSLLARQKPVYDVILCLSLTKWIHLNWGDEGLKRAFKRMFLMLQPGGRLLLEAQPFNSYSRRKNLSEKIRRNYDSIQFKPNQFVDYLMSEEVGFASYEALGISDNTSKGFQRPLYLFTKSVSGESYDALGVDISENLKKTSTSSHQY